MQLLVVSLLSIITLLSAVPAFAEEKHAAPASSPPTTHENSRVDMDVELKFTMPAPVMNGYIFGLPINLGIQFNKLIAIEMRAATFSRDVYDQRTAISADVGLVPIVHDRRKGVRGWVTQLGGSLGYTLEWGDIGSEDQGLDIPYNRVQFITGNWILKSTHWWRKHIGIIFQIRLVGGVSFHVKEWVVQEDDTVIPSSFETIVTSDKFAFAKETMWGLRLFWGIAF